MIPKKKNPPSLFICTYFQFQFCSTKFNSSLFRLFQKWIQFNNLTCDRRTSYANTESSPAKEPTPTTQLLTQNHRHCNRKPFFPSDFTRIA